MRGNLPIKPSKIGNSKDILPLTNPKCFCHPRNLKRVACHCPPKEGKNSRSDKQGPHPWLHLLLASTSKWQRYGGLYLGMFREVSWLLRSLRYCLNLLSGLRFFRSLYKSLTGWCWFSFGSSLCRRRHSCFLSLLFFQPLLPLLFKVDGNSIIT